MKITEDGLQAIVDLSGGDMRKAVTAMQSASQFYAGTEVGGFLLSLVAPFLPLLLLLLLLLLSVMPAPYCCGCCCCCCCCC